jgi:hypothetical protein
MEPSRWVPRLVEALGSFRLVSSLNGHLQDILVSGFGHDDVQVFVQRDTATRWTPHWGFVFIPLRGR